MGCGLCALGVQAQPDTPPCLGPLTLADCVAEGLARQPTIAASRASLASAEAQRRSLDGICLASLTREMKIRKQQASLGVTIATAGLTQAEWETTYAVTRNYFSVIYATKQEAVARGLVNKLKAAQEKAALLAKAGNPDFVVTDVDVDRLAANIDLVELKHIEAAQGIKRAAAALREAMGVGPECTLVLAATDLPPLQENLNREELIALALARRGEMIQATTALTVTQLEVEAQRVGLPLPLRQTFASGADLHVQPVPQGVSNNEYRPGAIGLEMPPNLAGKRADRVEVTEHLGDRAAAVVDKTRNLITLEAEAYYLKWEEAALKLRALSQTAARAARVAQSVKTRFDIGKVAGEELIHSQTLADQAQAAYNEALYHHALALAALERITAGGFLPAFRSNGNRICSR
jgi:outer membrane protein TolC